MVSSYDCFMWERFSASLYSTLSKGKKIIVDTFNDFIEDDCYTKSSTLTFYTIQAIVPFLAFFLAIAKGFGFDTYLESLIQDAFTEQKEAAAYSLTLAESMLRHIKEGTVIGFGIVILLWAMVNFLGYIEFVLNQIWKIKEQRSFYRKISDYLAIVILCPLILLISSSVTVFLKASITHLKNAFLIEISPYLLFALKLSPWILVWLLFFLLYTLLPNMKLTIWPLIIAAVIAGTIFQLWQVILINFQIKMFNYNIVYGAFAVLPLLFIWLQVGWIIALGGAELAAKIENVTFYGAEHRAGFLETISRKQIGLMILLQCLFTFYSGKPALTDVQITKALKIPLNITKTILDIFIKGKILSAVELKKGRKGYHPFSDPANMTIKQVCDVIEKSDDFEISVATSEYLKKITDLLNKLNESETLSEGNLKLNELFKLTEH